MELMTEKNISSATVREGLKLTRAIPAEAKAILTADALQFVFELETQFGARRRELLAKRAARARALNAGEKLRFLDETLEIRQSDWHVANAPKDLNDRRTEITGPAERKMMINALNSGAKVFMADLEDALSPTWENSVLGQVALSEAVRRELSFVSPEGKSYALKEDIATLVVRPRGWHLEEKNVLLGGLPISGSFFDFGLYFFHNAKELLARGSGPYFYLPKMESHLEARLWNDVFKYAQTRLGVAQGSIRATVLIETIPAAFEMDEILFELREHAAGLNAGRWDYLFSMIKKFVATTDVIFPDRAQMTMTVPYMKAYTELLVSTCHRRGAHAIGGMAAFIPSRRDAEVNALAFKKVAEDKEREAKGGFDGTWVAHPDLVPVAKRVFDEFLGFDPHQKQTGILEKEFDASRLLPCSLPDGKVTEAGFRNNVNVALQYIESWLRGLGAVAIHNLMEDAATAEISRAELWQWVHKQITLEGGQKVSAQYFEKILSEEKQSLQFPIANRLEQAAQLLRELVLNKDFTEFLTLPAYQLLDQNYTKENA